MNRLDTVLGMPGPNIAVTVTESLDPVEVELMSQLVDVAELRADQFRWNDMEAIDTEVDKLAVMPLLLTIRSAKERGGWQVSDESRYRVFGSLMPKVDGIDIELTSTTIAEGVIKRAHELGKVVIVSSHIYDRMPPEMELDRQLEEAQELGANYVKFAVTPQNLDDFQILSEYTLLHRDEDLITIAMSKTEPEEESPLTLVRDDVDFGKLSRLVLPYLGSRLVYSYSGDQPVAPGQLHYTEMAELHDRFIYDN